MAKLKFVSDKQPRDHAERLFKLQAEIAKKKAELAVIVKEATQLEAYLLRVNKGKSFTYDGPLYQKVVKISHHERMIIDNDAVKKMLKARTPYKDCGYDTVKIDFVYED